MDSNPEWIYKSIQINGGWCFSGGNVLGMQLDLKSKDLHTTPD